MTLASALLHLYPRAWRRRYGHEMRALLAEQRLSLRTIADLVAGAIDARMYPQTAAQPAPPSAGARPVMRTSICNPAGISTQDLWRSAGWLIGGSFFLTMLGIALQATIGPNAFSEGLLYSSFPAALMLSNECTYLKRYSRRARLTMAGGGALLIIAIVWAAVLVANAI